MLELAQAVTPYVFAGAGIYAVWSAIESVRGHLVTIQDLLRAQNIYQKSVEHHTCDTKFALWTIKSDIKNIHDIAKIAHDAPSLAFEYVTCGGCGESVKTGEDGFTPAPHDCQYEKYSMHSN